MKQASKLVVLNVSSAVAMSFLGMNQAALAAPAESGSTQNAQLIVKQVQTAMHADALKSAGPMLLEGVVEARGCSAKARLASDPATRSAAIYAEGGGPAASAEGVDGGLAWWKDASGMTHRARASAVTQNLISDAYWATGGLANLQWPAQVRYQASVKFGGDRADVLEVTPEGGKMTSVWISQKTRLPLQWSRRDEVGQVLTTYSDYRTVADTVVPLEQTVTDADGTVHKYTLQTVTPHADRATVAALVKMPEQSPHDFEIRGARSTTVNMRMAGRPYVDVYVDGRGPFNFMIDASASLTLSTQTAKKLGVPLFGDAADSATTVANATPQYAMIADLRVGDAHVYQQSVQVRQLNNDKSGMFAHRVDGVIGAEMLERFVSTFDFANQQLTLSIDHPQTNNLAASVAPGATRPQDMHPACLKGAGQISSRYARAGIERVALPVLTISAKRVNYTSNLTSSPQAALDHAEMARIVLPVAVIRATRYDANNHSVIRQKTVFASADLPRVVMPLALIQARRLSYAVSPVPAHQIGVVDSDLKQVTLPVAIINAKRLTYASVMPVTQRHSAFPQGGTMRVVLPFL